MNKIYLIILVSLVIVCGCSLIKNSPVYSTYYREGIIDIESSNIILNIYENKKYLQYKLIFDGRKLVKKIAKEISKEEYYDSYKKWEQQLINNADHFSSLPKGEYFKTLTKKFGNIEIEQYDKVGYKQLKNIQYETWGSKIEIKMQKKSRTIILKEANIFDFTIIKNKHKNYLLILQGTQGSGSFSSIIYIYKLG